MKKTILGLVMLMAVIPAFAQWNSAAGKWATGVYWGSDYNPLGSKNMSWYQVSVRETRWLTNRIGLGAEVGYTKVAETGSNKSPLSANVFGKLRLIAGLYGEYGYGFTTVPYNNSVSGASARGAYWAVGISKKLGNHLAVDLQYRNAPTADMLSRNYSNGLRAGLHFKL